MNPLGKLAIPTALLLLAACGSSPPVRYYSLEPLQAVAEQESESPLIVGLGPLRLPEYLKRSQIVTRSNTAEVAIDEFARWSEPLDKAIHGVVAANVDGLVPDVVMLAYPYITGVEMNHWVVGRIDQFDADAMGNVVLSVQWALVGPENELLAGPERRRYLVQAARANDADAMARAMNDALLQFSQDIAATLNTRL